MSNDNFFGRQECLKILEKRVSGLKEGYRQNIAIIGDEQVGKTSLVFKFLSKFYDPRIIPAYLEVRPEPAASFIRRSINTLLYSFLSSNGSAVNEDLNSLTEKSLRYIPKSIEKVKAILQSLEKRGTKKDRLFTELFSLPESIHQESGKSFVIILDEFHNLEHIGIKYLYEQWSKLLLSQKNTMFIIVSSMKFKTKMLLSKELSLLFGNFEVLAIEPFDIKTSGEYLSQKIGPLDSAPGLKDFIVHFTGGCPLYLEIISRAVKQSGQDELPQIIESLIFDSCGILNQRFSNYIKRFTDLSHNNDCISILYLISNGRNRIKDIAHILHKQQSRLSLRINHLVELDTITRSGDFLRINDRLFSLWIKFAYQEKLHPLSFGAKKQNSLFRDYIKERLEEFRINAQKPLIQQITELLYLFEDEVIQVEAKRIRLSHFKEIKPLEFKNNSLRNGILGRSNDSLWIMGVKRDLLTEEDVAVFAKECKRYRHKLQRKIIVTLRDIDSNTRLRALEEKIWTWDTDRLNQILDLFSRPCVIT